jgi:transcriptional regulator with XRE-family HTH domain
MQQLGWSQSELARKLGWEPQHLSQYMKGREPGLDKIAELAAVFGISVSDLFRTDQAPFSIRAKPTPFEALEVLREALEQKEGIHEVKGPKDFESAVSILRNYSRDELRAFVDENRDRIINNGEGGSSEVS